MKTVMENFPRCRILPASVYPGPCTTSAAVCSALYSEGGRFDWGRQERRRDPGEKRGQGLLLPEEGLGLPAGMEGGLQSLDLDREGTTGQR